MASLALSIPASAATLYYEGVSNQTWNSSANWTTSSSTANSNPSSLIAVAADDAVFHITSVTATTAVTMNLAGNQAANSLTFRNTGAFNIGPNSGTNTGNKSLTIGSGGITKNLGSAAVNIGRSGTANSVSAVIGANQTWTNNSTTGALTVGTTLNSASAPSATLALSGRQLTLDGAGDFQFVTPSTAGIVLIGNSASSLIKNGAGTLSIGGANSTLDASITVSAGTLYVTGTLGTSTVEVGATGTVGRNGATTNGGLGDNLTILAGGNIDLLGATLGSSSMGILGMTSGTLTLGGLAFTDLLNWDYNAAAVGTYELIETATAVSLTTAFDSEANAFTFLGGNKGYFTTTGNSLNVVIIPEPGAALLGGLGMLALLLRRR